jgi:hypothetical protein
LRDAKKRDGFARRLVSFVNITKIRPPLQLLFVILPVMFLLPVTVTVIPTTKIYGAFNLVRFVGFLPT